MSIGECVLLLFLFQISVILWSSCQKKVDIFGNSDSIKKMLKEYKGDIVTIKTDAGDVSGILVQVDDDFIQLLKVNYEIVIVPLSGINGIQREGKGYLQPASVEDQLKKYIGKEVEVFLSTELLQGILIKVSKGYFTVKLLNPGYAISGKTIQLINDKIAYLHVIK